MKIKRTERGFLRIDFEDLYESKCSLQESSLATDNAIWLGVHEGSPQYKTRESVRMHLNQEQVKELLPFLVFFAENGYLPEPEP